MKVNQADYLVATMCRLPGVSTSGFHAWLKCPKSARMRRDAELAERLEAVRSRSHGTCGALASTPSYVPRASG